MSVTRVKFLITTELGQFDQLSFDNFYTPIIGGDGVYLYLQLNNINELLKIMNRSNSAMQLEDFLGRLNWDFQRFENARILLEQTRLLRTFVSKDSEQDTNYHLILGNPKSIVEAFNDPKLNLLLKQKVGSKNNVIFDNLNFLSEYQNNFFMKINNQNAYEITNFELLEDLHNSTNASLLPKEIKEEFYSNIFGSFLKPFEISDVVYNLIYQFHIEESVFDIRKISLFGFKALKSKNGKYYIDEKYFEMILKENLLKKSSESEKMSLSSVETGFAIVEKTTKEDYYDFWVNLINFSLEDFEKHYYKYFDNLTPETFYSQYINNNNKMSSTLISKINDAISREIPIAMINLVMSFTYTWIKKLNVKYFDKTLESCSWCVGNLESLFNHFFNIIVSDIDTKNRFDYSQESIARWKEYEVLNLKN